MNFLKKLLTKKPSVPAGQPFWEWFAENEKTFFHIVKARDLVDDQFIQKIMPRLQDIHDTLYCETGMCDDSTAELVISAQGDIKSFVFVEELVAAAPVLAGWKFTALKPAMGLHDMGIRMDAFVFNSKNISFLDNADPEYPDLVRLIFIHQDYTPENKDLITQGVFLFLESFLGEQDTATLIDEALVKGPEADDAPAIPMEKLMDFLSWKQKEFVEKYQGVRHDTENDNHSGLEGEDEEGLPSIGVVNQDLLNWDAKASHPWMLVIAVDYEKTKGVANRGMPDEKHYKYMQHLEEEWTRMLPDSAGYLSLGRETYNGKTNLYMACKEYRNASKITHDLLQTYKQQLACTYEIYKDKYWLTMEKFR